MSQNILLGVSGGIAAYKSADLVRRLKDTGATVRVVMTGGAQSFITPMTMQAVSGLPVHHELLDPNAEAAMGHIELAKWADHIIVAPASANTIARIANGLADDLLSTLCLASAAPLVICPAMNQQMYRAAATQQNLAILKSRGVTIWGPASGEQACGDVGPGRMLEPMEITANYLTMTTPDQSWAGKKVVITAGPTRERIDPVRYLSNFSSGKMGVAIADAAAAMGASVELVHGPMAVTASQSGVTATAIESAEQMLAAVLAKITDAEVFIGCAAVADFRVAEQGNQKIKKQQDQDELNLTLIKNPDILATVANLQNRPFTVGFAAETSNVEDYAKAKLKRKNLDMIVANNVANPKIGFGSEQNAVTVYWQDGYKELSLSDKSVIAADLMRLIADHLQNQ